MGICINDKARKQRSTDAKLGAVLQNQKKVDSLYCIDIPSFSLRKQARHCHYHGSPQQCSSTLNPD
jgi:hypothetical protein